MCSRYVKIKADTMPRLRQVDVKAEHFERQVTRAEQERDEWEKKHGVSYLSQETSRQKLTQSTGSSREVPAIQARARRGRCPDGVPCKLP